MQFVKQVEAMEALLKALDKGIRELRAEYQYASATVKGLKREYQTVEAGAFGARFETYLAMQRERHNQLADLVPASRQARIWVMQAKNGGVHGSLGSVVEPLLGYLFEHAMASAPLPVEHGLWDIPLGPFMVLRSELPLVNLAYARGGAQYEADFRALQSKGTVTLRDLRPLLLRAMDLPQTLLTPCEMNDDVRFGRFLETRAWLQKKLSPDAYELVKAYRQFL